MPAPLPHAQGILAIPEVAAALQTSPEAIALLVQHHQLIQVEILGAQYILCDSLENFLAKLSSPSYNGEIAPIGPGGPQLLDNCTPTDSVPCSEGDNADMAKINQYITVNGKKHWVTASTTQELVEKVLALQGTPQTNGRHPFADYAWTWFHTYSEPNVEAVTAITYKRQLTLHILPAFQGLTVEEITTDHVQALFNGMTGAKATKEKVRIVLNQILAAAVEDGLLRSNPLKSKRLKITGKASKTTRPYTVEQMKFLVQNIGIVKNPLDRAYLALQALHPLRLEEVLGLQGQDIDVDRMEIHISRAVTHPDRNQPEIKDTKTAGSTRIVGLSSLALPYLPPLVPGQFLFDGTRPLSYVQAKHMCARIQKDTGFPENITPIRFRTTVLTDLYDQTKDIKLTQEAAGHTTPTMTLKHYVKGRETSAIAAAAVERAYTS